MNRRTFKRRSEPLSVLELNAVIANGHCPFAFVFNATLASHLVMYFRYLLLRVYVPVAPLQVIMSCVSDICTSRVSVFTFQYDLRLHSLNNDQRSLTFFFAQADHYMMMTYL